MTPASDSSQPATPPPRKPAGLAWESFVERRIREAQAAGAFDNLPGQGQPIPGIDDPLDDNWWVRQKLRDEGINVLPPVLEARLDRERTLAGLGNLRIESHVREQLVQLNHRLQTAIRAATDGPSLTAPLVDIEATVASWRTRRDSHN